MSMGVLGIMSDGEEEKKKKINSVPLVACVPPSSSSTDAGDPSLLQIPTLGRMSTGILAETEDEKKQRQQQHKKRSKNWTRQETLRLIRLRSEFEPRFARSGRKSELWDEISVALQRESICRDAQQCRDKWEKLTAGYKEVRDGIKNRQDNPFFEELQPLLSARTAAAAAKVKDGAEPAAVGVPNGGDSKTDEEEGHGEGEGEGEEETEDGSPPGKRRCRYWTGTGTNDLDAVLENLFARQQKFFRELLDSMERREQMREQIRQEKEDRWQAEERAQRCSLSEAMIRLSRKLLQQQSQEFTALNGVVHITNNNNNNSGGGGGGNPKKRSKNWKRAEVLRLIKFRGEMETKFMKSSRRAALWDEVAELLSREGIRRDGKQCREKWDKLVAEYKEVVDGKRDRGESPYFAELTPIVGRPPAEQQVLHQQQLQTETTVTS